VNIKKNIKGDFGERHEVQKLFTPFEFPFELDLRDFCTENIEGSTQMELRGVVVHSGATPGSGHYFVFLKDERNNWWKYNDESISSIGCPIHIEVNEETVEACFQSQFADNQIPYILLYKKTN
jgi:hypothetical protein